MTRWRWMLGGSVLLLAPGAVYWGLVGTHTRFAGDFTERRFEELRPGDSELRVRELIGAPLRREAVEAPAEWCYPWRDAGSAAPTFIVGTQVRSMVPDEWCVTLDAAGVVEEGARRELGVVDSADLQARFGVPSTRWPAGARERLFYSEPRIEGMSWEWREVEVQGGRVRRLVRESVYQ